MQIKSNQASEVSHKILIRLDIGFINLTNEQRVYKTYL